MLPVLHAIIPAGGAGTRLWPLSRQGHPKFLLDPVGTGKTLLQETFARLRPLSLTITVVTGAAHYDEVCRQLPELSGDGDGDTFPGEIIVEPSPRDSMAAIGIAAYNIQELYGPEAIVGSFAADHLIDNQEAFAAAVQSAVVGAQKGYLTTVGITPTEPSTGFGYIETALEPLPEDPTLFPVERFVEKPDAETAAKYVADSYLWNAGMFVSKASTITQALANQLPVMDETLRRMAANQMQHLIDEGESGRLDRNDWDSLTRIAIDYALAEPLAAEGKVAVVRPVEDLGWSDIGDFEAVARLRHDASTDSQVITVDAPEPLVMQPDGSERLVAVVGIPDAVVVETADAVLVTTRQAAQQVKDVVDQLNASGKQQYL